MWITIDVQHILRKSSNVDRNHFSGMMVQYRSRERLSSCGETSTGTTPPFAASPLRQGLHYGSALELHQQHCSPTSHLYHHHQLPRYPSADGRNMSPPTHAAAPLVHQMLLAQSPPTATAGILHAMGSTTGSTASTTTPTPLRFVPQPLSEETLMDVSGMAFHSIRLALLRLYH